MTISAYKHAAMGPGEGAKPSVEMIGKSAMASLNGAGRKKNLRGITKLTMLVGGYV